LGRRLQERSTGVTFVSADGGRNAIDIEAVGSSDTLSELVKILNDGVATLHDSFLAGSSSGVQMIGGRRPSARHAASIVTRIVALARCLQFQVSKYVTGKANQHDDNLAAIAAAVVRAVERYTDSHRFADDLTILLLRRCTIPAAAGV
jgi:hypothetical protein